MKLLATAGNTFVPIDDVRGITNVFTGRTGTRIALRAHARGHEVTLLTSHPEVVTEMLGEAAPPAERWRLLVYRTFVDLRVNLERETKAGDYAAIIHSAAVSDYRCAGVYAPAPNVHFQVEKGEWQSTAPSPLRFESRSAGKVKSDEKELWLRLVRTPKLIDAIRAIWDFRGILVKFKLEVGLDDATLLDVAERSRLHSAADLMVANTLEGAADWAYLGPYPDYRRIERPALADILLDAVERLQEERTHG